MNGRIICDVAIRLYMDREAALEKIRKCLALSESPNENEARTALLMARHLMAEYKIGSSAELSADQRPEERRTSVTFTTLRDSWVLNLMKLIGPRYCCRPFSSKEYRKKTRTAAFAGFPQDLDICVPAFELAVSTIRSNIIRMKKDPSAANSYASGFIRGLAEAYEVQDAESNQNEVRERSLITVMAVPKEVDEYVRDNFTTSRISVRSYPIDESAYRTGMYDGRSHLNRKVRGEPVRQLR